MKISRAVIIAASLATILFATLLLTFADGQAIPPGQRKKTPTPAATATPTRTPVPPTATPTPTPTPIPTPPSTSPAWAKIYSSGCNEALYQVIPAQGGGFLAVGYTCTVGSYDGLFIRTDDNGNILRTVVHGSADRDEAVWSVAPLATGGYVFAASFDPQYTGDPVPPPNGSDVWVGILDANLNLVAHKTYGGAADDIVKHIEQTADSGFFVVGSTKSYGAGGSDVWALKLRPDLSVEWQVTVGSAGQETGLYGMAIPHGFVVVGERDGDALFLNISNFGELWVAFTFGGLGVDTFNHAHLVADGGLVVSGTTTSYGAGGRDVWTLRLNASFMPLWQYTYGTPSDDSSISYSLHPLLDGSFVFGGHTAATPSGFKQAWTMLLSGAGIPTVSKRHELQPETSQDIYSIRAVAGGFVLGGTHNAGLAYRCVIIRTTAALATAGATFDLPTTATPIVAARGFPVLLVAPSQAVPANRVMTGYPAPIFQVTEIP